MRLAYRSFQTGRPLCFDRAKFFAAKRAWKASRDIESTTMAEAHDMLRTYALGQTGLPINVHACLLGSSRVRGDVVLPHTPQLSTDASDRVLVFASADSEEAATATRLGAHIVGGEDLVQQVAGGRSDFSRVLSTPEMFPSVVKIARHLGPKGLMPSPARGTVSTDIEGMMRKLTASTRFETDETSMAGSGGYVHLVVGRTGWTLEKIEENLMAFVGALEAVRPVRTGLGKFVSRIALSTGGPGTGEETGLAGPAIVFPRKELLAMFAKTKTG